MLIIKLENLLFTGVYRNAVLYLFANRIFVRPKSIHFTPINHIFLIFFEINCFLNLFLIFF